MCLRNKFKKVVLAFVATVMAMTMVMPGVAFADASRTVTLGVDLSAEQRAKVLDFFNLTEDDLKDMEVINVNNQDERRYLEGTLSDDIIGWKTYSCSYIEPKTSGGLRVETANLTYVTKNTLYNALQTAGVENCSLVVTAPFPVSGTGALTGVFMTYEQRGMKLDDEKKEAATTELVETAALESEYGEEVAEVISNVKDEVISSDHELSDDEIRDIIKTAAKLKGVDLNDGDMDTILGIVSKLQGLDYDLNAFSSTLDDFKAALNGATEKAEEATGFFEAIANWFQGVIDWFKGLFGMAPSDDGDTAEPQQTDSLIDNLNTDIFSLDSGNATDNNTKATTPAADGSEQGTEPAGGETTTDGTTATVEGAGTTEGGTEGATEGEKPEEPVAETPTDGAPSEEGAVG